MYLKTNRIATFYEVKLLQRDRSNFKRHLFLENIFPTCSLKKSTLSLVPGRLKDKLFFSVNVTFRRLLSFLPSRMSLKNAFSSRIWTWSGRLWSSAERSCLRTNSWSAFCHRKKHTGCICIPHFHFRGSYVNTLFKGSVCTSVWERRWGMCRAVNWLSHRPAHFP